MSPPESGEQRFRAFLPEQLMEKGEPVFAEPWQAQVFAMTVSLYERGLFSWNEWARSLSEQLAARAAAGDEQGGLHYYVDWLAALETLVSDCTGVHPAALAELKDRWERAYRSTPHGQKVAL